MTFTIYDFNLAILHERLIFTLDDVDSTPHGSLFPAAVGDGWPVRAAEQDPRRVRERAKDSRIQRPTTRPIVDRS